MINIIEAKDMESLVQDMQILFGEVAELKKSKDQKELDRKFTKLENKIEDLKQEFDDLVNVLKNQSSIPRPPPKKKVSETKKKVVDEEEFDDLED